MRIAQVRGLIVVGVLVLVALGTSWWAIAHDTQSNAGSGQCPPGAVVVDIRLPETQEVKVKILNSTKQSGLADTAAVQLEEYGFTIEGTGDSKKELETPVEIHYGPKTVGGAHLVNSYFTDVEAVFDLENDDDFVMVILGDGFLQTNTESDARQKIGSLGSPTAPDGTCGIKEE